MSNCLPSTSRWELFFCYKCPEAGCLLSHVVLTGPQVTWIKWLHSDVPALQVWAAALKQDSPLLSPQAMAKLPEDDAADIPMLCAELLQRHRHRLQADAEITVASLLAACLLHWSVAVRHAAGQAATLCLAGSQTSEELPMAP